MLLLRFFLRIYNLYFSPDKNLAARIRDMTGFVPARLAIFKLAFSHKSNQNRGDLPVQTNNERLEYLGDAVLGTIVAEYLFKKYPNGNEGFLTKMRSKIVKRNSLNRIGDEMGLDVLLTEYNRTRLSSSMLGNAVEALVGAVYLEKGYRDTKRFVIRRMLRNYVDMDHLETVDDNYKSQLLEYCQKNGRSINYQIVSKYKHERRDRFKIGVVIGGETIATADDFNKKAAEQLASRKALVKMGVLEPDAESGAALPVKRTSKQRALIIEDADRDQATAKPAPRPEKTAKPERAVDNRPSEPAAARIAEPAANSARANQELAPPAPGASVTSTSKPKRGRRQRGPTITREIGHATRVAAASLFALDEHRRGLKGTGTPHVERRAEPIDPGELVIENEPRRRGAFGPKPDPGTPVHKRPVGREETKSTPVATQQEKPAKRPDKRRRKRRPLPLHILGPAVEDASAVVSILTGPPQEGSQDSQTEADDWENVEFELQSLPPTTSLPTPWEDAELEYALVEAPTEEPPRASHELSTDLRGAPPAPQHRPRRRRPQRSQDEATPERTATENE